MIGRMGTREAHIAHFHERVKLARKEQTQDGVEPVARKATDKALKILEAALTGFEARKILDRMTTGVTFGFSGQCTLHFVFERRFLDQCIVNIDKKGHSAFSIPRPSGRYFIKCEGDK